MDFFLKIAFFGLASGEKVKRITPNEIVGFVTNSVSDFGSRERGLRGLRNSTRFAKFDK